MKDEKHILLPIQEDVYKSCESISTLASDLFEDVRASIQKSSKKSTPSTSNIKVSSSPSVPLFQTHDCMSLSPLCVFSIDPCYLFVNCEEHL